MRRTSRLVRLIGAAALLISMLAATVTPAVAQQDSPSGPTMDHLYQHTDPSFAWGANAIFYPWVANEDNFGLGGADTSISVQNLEDRDGQIWIYVGNGDNSWSLATTAYLSAYASKTFTAAQLGIAEGEGAPVAVRGYQWIPGFTLPGVPTGGFLAETAVILSNPVADDTDDDENDGGDTTQAIACVVNAYTSDGSFGGPYPFVAAVAFSFDGVDYAQGDLVEWDTQADLQAILNAVNSGNLGELINPFGGLNQDGDCLDAVDVTFPGFLDSLALAGVAKTAVDGETLPYTTTADTAVSGYNALNGIELLQFDEWYLPIVQTNCGPGGCWDSMLRVANLNDLNSAVTIRFFPADDGSGSLATGFQLQGMVNGGDTWHVNLGDYVPEGWVGSAHIYSDGTVFAMVDRYKVGYNMWITNTGSSADYENIAQNWSSAAGGRYALFAPHVLMDYFGWNTGINVANLYNGDNNVSIQYFNMLGNATQVLNQRLAAHGMTYFYDPSVAAQDNNAQDVTNDPNAGVVGSAIIWSDWPVAAAVDATKYPETDPNGGADLFQATSYSATQNVFTWQAVPLVQKGNPADGMGATSGINIMNPNPTAATANVYFVNPSGFNAQNFGVSSVTVPGFANGFVYTLWQHNLPNGFVGAAQVVSNIPVAAVSANVDYQVDGDGSAIFNAFNPCGLYRTTGGCTFGDPFDTSGRSVTKYFVDEDGEPIAGVEFHIVNDNPDFPYQRGGVSNVDGQATFTNVPVGNYVLNVDSVPAAYEMPVNPADVFTLEQGEDEVLTNELLWAQGVTKTVVVAGSLDDDGEIDDETVTLAGVNVSVYENIGEDFIGAPVAGELEFTGVTDADGFITERLAPGNYILCTWDEDGAAVTYNGETVGVDLADSGAYGDIDAFCEIFTVVAGVYTDLINEVEITEGILNIFVYTLEPTDVGGVEEQVGVADVEVCLFDDAPTEIACAFTNANGFVTFLEVPEGSYTIEVQADGYIVVNVDGGTTNVSNPVFVEDGASVTPAVVTFDYSPTDDLAQDGWMDDVAPDGTPRGSFDLEIEVDESTAQLVQKTVTLNGDAVEATVTIATDDGEIVNIVNDDGTTTSQTLQDAEVETGPDGIVQFVVEPGTYDICSTVIVDTDGTGTNDFPYTICEDDVLVTETFELYEIPNEHLTGTITKNVLVLDSCPVDFDPDTDDPLVDCTFVAPADDAGITVTAETSAVTDSALFTGTYATVGGSVTLTLPVSADVGDYVIESDVNGDLVSETVTIVAGANADLDNEHIVGQLDVGWSETLVPDGTTQPAEETTYCLYVDGTAVGTGAAFVGDAVQCVTVPVDALGFGDGIYFTNIPEGTYFIALSTDSGATSDSTDNALLYEPIADLLIDGDVVDIAGPNAGYGELQAGQTFDFIFDVDNGGTVLISGYMAALTVSTESGAYVQVAEGVCSGTPTPDGSSAQFVGGSGEVTFTGLDASNDYCIQVFDTALAFVTQQDVTTVSGDNDAAVAIPTGWGLLAILSYVDCDDDGAFPAQTLNAAIVPSAGDELANAVGSEDVCDGAPGTTAQSASAAYAAGSLPSGPFVLVAVSPTDDAGYSYYLLPSGAAYGFAGIYTGSSSGAHQNQTGTPGGLGDITVQDITVDADGDELQWILIQ